MIEWESMEKGEMKVRFLAWVWRLYSFTEEGNTDEFGEEKIYICLGVVNLICLGDIEMKMSITQRENWARDSDLEIIGIERPSK